MSHELRTPLNIIIGYTDMLRDEGSSSDAAESDRLMGRIRTAASNLLHLVDMVLDLGKLDAGKIPVQSTSLALETFVEDLAQRERIRLAPGVVFRCNADPDLPAIETDRTKLTMILDNLISNAIKFTQTGSIVVRVTHQRDQQCVQFEVEDTGPGIEPGHLETIFEPFHQLERSSDNPFGGFGLGLAIVHRHVGLLGGPIAVRSTVDVGTCFTLPLPYRTGATRARDVGPGPTATAVSAATESPLSVEPRAASAQPL
jgi:signal transduction histidine kinase